MIGGSVALDTNQAIAILNGTIGDDFLDRFSDLALPVIVLGELRFGAYNSANEKENTARIELLISRCRILSMSALAAECYARSRMGLKKKGRPIPENDLWIAAICLEHSLPLATSDAHFSAVEGLQVIKPA